ncbi:hypothetical protein QR680_015161 [Steinernema hermaphroditum]|nr:hypothetical protein QR680_015161 [Steinernema hermaphroditum]
MAIGEPIQIKSGDGQVFEFSPEFVNKSLFLKQMIADTDFNGKEAIEFESLPGEVLDIVSQWLRMHADTPARDDEDRQIMKYNLTLTQADTALFDSLVPRKRLANVINAAYYLEMPDLIDTLVKYVSVSVDGKTGEQLSNWLEIPLAQPPTVQPDAITGDADKPEGEAEASAEDKAEEKND